MTKPIAYSKIFDNTLDYIEAVEYIDEVLGFSQRSAHVHFYPNDLASYVAEDESSGQQRGGAYMDYWHYVLENFFDNVSNDNMIRYGPYNFTRFAVRTEEKYGPKNWRTVIAKTWAAEYPDEYNIWMSW